MTGKLLILSCFLITFSLYIHAKAIALSPLITWLSAAQISGIVGIVALSWSYISALRNASMEWLFGGLDKAYKIHHWLGGIGFLAIIYHPVFLIISSLPLNTISLYLLPNKSIPYTLGIIALYVLLLLISLTLFVDLPYRLWKKTHEWMGVVILLGGLHYLLIVSEISNSLPLKIWLLTWIFVALISFIYKRYIYYIASTKYEYVVESVVTQGKLSILRMRIKNFTKSINVKAGQYIFLTIPNIGWDRDEHPFTVLDSSREILTIGFKRIGRFTDYLQEARPGMIVSIRGPYGYFGEAANSKIEMIWIAGGIGITPFASMVKEIRPDQRVGMIHITRDGGAKIFTDYFENWSRIRPNFKWIKHVTSQAGRLNASAISDIFEISKRTYFFICGPIPMMESVTNQLQQMGIKKRKIVYEDFNLK